MRKLSTVLALVVAAGACQGEPREQEIEDTARPTDTTAVGQQSPVDTTALRPRIDQRPGGPVLVLTREMERALGAAYPGFHHWALADYMPEIRGFAPATDRHAPFAVIGDFDGEGEPDVIVEGHDATRSLMLALLAGTDSVRIIAIDERPLPPGERQRDARWTFLSLVPRGVVRADTLEEGGYDPIPITIDRDGFEVVFYGKAANFYYWRDGRFVQWITSD